MKHNMRIMNGSVSSRQAQVQSEYQTYYQSCGIKQFLDALIVTWSKFI